MSEYHTKKKPFEQMTIQPKKEKKIQNKTNVEATCTLYSVHISCCKATSAYIYGEHGKKWWFLFCIPFEILPFRNDDGNIHIGMRFKNKHCAIYKYNSV